MKIGITFSETKYHNYPKWMTDMEGLEVVELSYEKGNIHDLEICDGVLLTGGIDIHPGFHATNYSLHYPYAPEIFSIKRDEFELDVLEKALQKKLPILGICRGLQLINSFFKGTLILDLGSKNQAHKNFDDIDRFHSVSIKGNSLLKFIIGSDIGEVNSAHHQAIDTLGEGLKATAYAEDGTIEAIELVDASYPFFMGVQWHPERLGDNPMSVNIREQFLKASSK